MDVLRDVINRLMNRKKDQLAFIATQLKDETELDSHNYKSLNSIKERLQLEIIGHINAPSQMIRKMLAISEYNEEGGIEWGILKHARKHLVLNRQGCLEVVIKNTERMEAILGMIFAGMFFCLFIIFALCGNLSSNPKIMLMCLMLSYSCVVPTMLFITPMRNIIAAKKVDRYLKPLAQQ